MRTADLVLKTAVTGLLMAFVAVATTSPARADMPEQGWKRVAVGLLAPAEYARKGDDLFVKGTATASAARWHTVVAKLLKNLDEVSVVPTAEVLARIKRSRNYRRQLSLGGGQQRLGLQRFEALKQAEALVHFDGALDAFNAVHVDTAEPSKVAEVEFYRGLALLEGGRVDAAHVALRNMFLLDPSRSFKEGYFGKPVENALKRALADLASHPTPGTLRFPVDRLVSLSKRTRISIWATVTTTGSGDDTVLHLRLFDARSRGVVLAEKVPVGGAFADVAEEKLSRLLTAWHSCHTEARVEGSFVLPQRRLGVFVEVGYTHTLLLKHGTRAFFHSPGAFIGVTWAPSENFLVFGRTIQMASLPDANGDLLDGFVTSRLALGVGLTGGTRNIRGFLEVGVEAAIAFNDIKLSEDADCKHFGESHSRCSGVTTFAAPGVWFGFVAGLGLRARIVKSWYARASLDFSLYVADTALISRLNFPLSLSLGIGNRF